jgi:hypothetical protein
MLVDLLASEASRMLPEATCQDSSILCGQLCADHAFVLQDECWGSPDSCVRCICSDGTDFTDAMPVKCERDDCGYECPTYETLCEPNPQNCGDWGVPCCENAAQVCDYTTRHPTTGQGTCRDLVCTDDAIAVAGIPVWSQGFVDYDLNGVYRRNQANDYATYEMTVNDRHFVGYPSAAGGPLPGWYVLPPPPSNPTMLLMCAVDFFA